MKYKLFKSLKHLLQNSLCHDGKIMKKNILVLTELFSEQLNFFVSRTLVVINIYIESNYTTY